MSRLSTLTRTLRELTAGEALPEIEPSDSDFAEKREAVAHAESILADLQQRHTKLNIAADKKEERLGRLAYAAETGASDGTEHDALAAQVERDQVELARLRRAIDHAGQDVQDAKLALHRLGLAGKLKLARRVTGAYAEAAEELEKQIGRTAKALLDLEEKRKKVLLSWPLPGPAPLGHQLSVGEVERSLAQEFWRVLPTNPADNVRRVRLPGAAEGSGLGDAKKAKSFAERAREAMASLVTVVERGVAAERAPAPAPEPLDEIDAMLPVAQAAQTELQIPSTREIIDLRKAKE